MNLHQEVIADELNLRGKARRIALNEIELFCDYIRSGTKESPLPSRAVERRFGLSGASVRKLRAFAQIMKYEIGSDINGPDSGYFWAKTADELDGTVHQLDSRIKALKRVLDAIKLTQARLRTKERVQEKLL